MNLNVQGLGEAALYVGEGNSAEALIPWSLPDQMQSFVNAAVAGGFAVSPTAGEAILDAIELLGDRLLAMDDNLRTISLQPSLGRLTGGRVMAPFQQQVAIDENGLVTRIKELVDSLHKAKVAISTSMENYRRSDEASREELTGRHSGPR